MKAIISYGQYFNLGRQYQVKFIYENEEETITPLVEFIKTDKQLKPYPYEFNKNNDNIIGGTNIPKEKLLSFINSLINDYKINVIIKDQEFITYNHFEIQEAIDNLHINATLYKGDYFNNKNVYYITFEYASVEQISEITYEIYFLRTYKNINISPYSVNRPTKRKTNNSTIIRCTNIPEEFLSYFIKRFIENHDIIINIGNEKLKDKFNNEQFESILPNLENRKTKTRKKEIQS